MTTLWSAEADRGYQSIGGSNPSGPILLPTEITSVGVGR